MKIICIGRNYADHAKELNNPVPDSPVIFMKPETALITENADFHYPDFSQNVHYEVEVVLRISQAGKNISVIDAESFYQEISLGIDFTARDIQDKCKKKGHPWEKAKAFDESAPVGRFIKKSELDDPDNIHFQLKKNGFVVQSGFTKDMIFSSDQIISAVSQYFMLEPGDLIFTGTPSGVGPVIKGDRLEAFLEENKLLEVLVR